MVRFTRSRDQSTRDEIWLLEHHPVYTRGAGCRDRPEPPGNHIPVIHSDRGGQITYHGPGQLIAYLLFDIKRLKTGPRPWVKSIEQWIMDFLENYHIPAARKHGAPGVYVADKKIAAMGLRISGGCCYHGFSINIDMDLSPFDWINPCGLQGLKVTQMKHHRSHIHFAQVRQSLIEYLNAITLPGAPGKARNLNQL